ncbi:MAG: YfhO family protein [Eubacterium sp.]|nr:YfhO family protein [Eubacterium sp.]
MDKFLEKENHSVRNRFLCYTLLFCILAVICFLYFWMDGKSFVHAGDGANQHYKALLYFSRWMREVVQTLVTGHELVIPNFSFRFGLGADLFTTLQYYVIGDPFALPSVFVPEKYIVYYYGFMVLFRLYLSGLAFLAYVNYMGKERNAALAGAVTYVFCAYALVASVHHPYFANPMLYFPLLLLGVEKIRREQKPGVLIVMVAVSAASNFYFFYMLALLVACYVVLEAVFPWEKGKWKEKAGTVLKIAGYSLVGGLISAALFLPVVLFFLSSMRLESKYVFDMFYGLSYYKKFLAGLITENDPGNWTHLGVSAVTILAVFLLLYRNEKRLLRLKAAFIIAMVAFLLPVAGHIGNGFSYVSNRWSWGVVFVLAYTLTELWPELFRLRKKDIVSLIVCFAVYFVLCTLPQDNVTGNFYFSSGLVMITLVILTACRISSGGKLLIPRKAAEFFVFAMVILGIGGMAFTMYAPSAGNYISKFKDAKNLQEDMEATEAVAVRQADSSNTFFRYSDAGSVIAHNDSVISGVSNTHIYWSLVNSSVTEFNNRMLIPLRQIFNIKGLDARTMLDEICSTKYFVTESKKDRKVPYGYEFVSDTKVSKPDGSVKDYAVFENKYALPLGYTYRASMTEEQAEQLTPLQLQEAMMQAVILESNKTEQKNQTGQSNMTEQKLSFTGEKQDYKVTCDSGQIRMQGNSFVVTEENQKAVLTFSGMPDSETYLFFKNLRFSDSEKHSPYNAKPSKQDLTVTAKHEDNSITENMVVYETPKYKWYNNRTDFLFHLYYEESPVTSFIIQFPHKGIYSFDSMEVYCQPFTNYAKEVDLLKEDVLENLDLHENEAYATNHITGTVHLEKSKYLFLSIPYSSGWKAYVDGEETKIIKANYAFMALELEAGEHEIELRYHTPGLKEGVFLSGIGIVIAGILAAKKRKPLKGNR